MAGHDRARRRQSGIEARSPTTVGDVGNDADAIHFRNDGMSEIA
jgi:hypothetical protein